MSEPSGGETWASGAPGRLLRLCSSPLAMDDGPGGNERGASPPSPPLRAACGKRAWRWTEPHPAGAGVRGIGAAAMEPLAAPCSLVAGSATAAAAAATGAASAHLP